jgi:hypothetical protein
VGITGGVTAMDSFLEKFFPEVALQSQAHASGEQTDAYCTYANINLQLFTSSLFLAAAVSGILGSFTTRQAELLSVLYCESFHPLSSMKMRSMLQGKVKVLLADLGMLLTAGHCVPTSLDIVSV